MIKASGHLSVMFMVVAKVSLGTKIVLLKKRQTLVGLLLQTSTFAQTMQNHHFGDLAARAFQAKRCQNRSYEATETICRFHTRVNKNETRLRIEFIQALRCGEEFVNWVVEK